MGFYVHLPSNNISGADSNTLCNYITHLKHPISLDGEWEVALTEVSYTTSWYNIASTSQCSVFSFEGIDLSKAKEVAKQREMAGISTDKQAYDGSIHALINSKESGSGSSVVDDARIEEMGGKIHHKIRIRPGFYSTKELVYTINRLLMKESAGAEPPLLELGPDGFLASVTGKRTNPETDKTEDSFINITGDAAEFLGYYWNGDQKLEPTHPSEGRHMMVCARRAQAKRGRFCMFVYTDIIRGIHVGDTISNLLRIVEIPDNINFGDQVTCRYDVPEYKRLVSNHIPSIHMYIKDDCGADMPFEFGRTIVTLHFRRVDS